MSASVRNPPRRHALDAAARRLSPGSKQHAVARLLLRPVGMTANPALFPLPARTSARSYPPGTQLNWLVRYVPIKPHLTGPALASLIEVGSGARGLGTIIDDSFVGIDVRIDGEPAPGMYPFSYDGGRVPFKAGSFHTVVSMDTLEHVPPANRVDFMNELLRISAARVILGFPSHTGNPGGDDFMRTLFMKLGMGAPAWLNEHDEFGLPPARDVEAILDQLGDWSWRPLPTAGDFVNLLAALADVIPGTASTIQPALETNAAEVEAWVMAGTFGSANRKVYLIERRDAMAPLVDLNRPATLITAISCPNCDGATEIAPPGVRCRGCGGEFAPDARGVFRLHRTAVAPRPVSSTASATATAPLGADVRPDLRAGPRLVGHGMARRRAQLFACVRGQRSAPPLDHGRPAGADPGRHLPAAAPPAAAVRRPAVRGDLPQRDAARAGDGAADVVRPRAGPRLQLGVVSRPGPGSGGAAATRSERRQGLLVAPAVI